MRIPKISICTITYNHEHCVTDCLNGVRLQDYPGPLQHVIADDSSIDNTVQAINACLRVPHKISYDVVSRQSNIGINLNLIDALRRCDGDYIALCEGDDFWVDKRKLSKQVEILEAHPELGMSTHECNKIYFPFGANRSFKRAMKLLYWDARLYGLTGLKRLAKARVAGPNEFWRLDRCHLENARRKRYHFDEDIDDRWIHPFCSIVMKRRVAEALEICLHESEGGHRLALMLGALLGGIDHSYEAMAVKRDQESSVTQDRYRKKMNQLKNQSIKTNNVIKRYDSILKFADDKQKMFVRSMKANYMMRMGFLDTPEG